MDKALLKELVEKGLTQAEIGERVGRGKSTVAYWLRKYGLSTKNEQIGYRTWDIDELEVAVASSETMSDILRKLELRIAGGNYTTIKKWIKKLKLDTSHLRPARSGPPPGWDGPGRFADEKVFVEHSTYKTSKLYKRLVRMGREEQCDECSMGTIWNGKPLRLHVDHINGICDDHRIENLRFLCPNCHSQTKTYAGRNVGK